MTPDPQFLMSAVRYSAGGRIEEVELDRSNKEAWDQGLKHWMDGGQKILRRDHPFVSPFLMATDDHGRRTQPPTAIIVDPASPSGTDALFGPALFFRQDGSGNLESVLPGDVELVRALPLWIRFDRLERRKDIPTAEEWQAAGNPWTPQLRLILSDPQRCQEVFVNALIARCEFDLRAYSVSDGPGEGSTCVEMMLEPHRVEAARRFVDAALDPAGRLVGPWAAAEGGAVGARVGGATGCR